MSKIAFLFPGQGAQQVGMGKSLYEGSPELKAWMTQFQEWIAPDLLEVMFNGPEDTLKQTQYTQPAIFCVSATLLHVFQQKSGIHPHFVAGHSLGEYGALCAAEVLSIETAAKLVKERSLLMSKTSQGAMAAVIGLAQEKLEALVAQVQHEDAGVVVIANYNTPEQMVISGTPQAVELVSAHAKAAGAKVIPLVVGGAFHSPLMTQANDQFQKILADVPFQQASCPVIPNVDAVATTDALVLKERLGEQIASAVRWSETLTILHEAGVETYIEMGPGKVLSAMVKKRNRHATVISISDMPSLTQALEMFEEVVSV